METIENCILDVLTTDGRTSTDDLARICETSKEEAEKAIANLEDRGVVRGYRAVVDWEKSGRNVVYAIIDIRLSLTRESGYDDFVRDIIDFPEVESCYLLSGEYDLTLLVRGKNMQQVAFFVAEKISTLPAVTHTNTHFVLRAYKSGGAVLMGKKGDDDRLPVCP